MAGGAEAGEGGLGRAERLDGLGAAAERRERATFGEPSAGSEERCSFHVSGGERLLRAVLREQYGRAS